MTLSMSSSNWLDFVESEYLASYIKDGGSTLKFAVPIDHDIATTLSTEIGARATELGYVVAHVDSGLTRVHMVEQLFFAVAEQIPWRDTVQRVVGRWAQDAGYAPPTPGDDPLFRRLARANDLDANLVRMELRREIAARVFRHDGLAKDFRVAMTQLAMAEVEEAQEAAIRYRVLTDWLCGRNRTIGAVKLYQIFTRITRANARYLFESLLVWIAFAGYSGLALTIDISRISIVRNPKDEQLHYSKAGVLDAYELLRQFIDGTDFLDNCLIVVLPHPDFLDEDVNGRGIGAYAALKFRVYDEVRDRRLVNPMASLVRLTEAKE